MYEFFVTLLNNIRNRRVELLLLNFSPQLDRNRFSLLLYLSRYSAITLFPINTPGMCGLRPKVYAFSKFCKTSIPMESEFLDSQIYFPLSLISPRYPVCYVNHALTLFPFRTILYYRLSSFFVLFYNIIGELEVED